MITDNFTGLNRFPNFTGRLEANGRYQFGGIESITLFGGVQAAANCNSQFRQGTGSDPIPDWQISSSTADPIRS